MRQPALMCVLGLVACAPPQVSPELTELQAFARAGEYRTWSGEPAPHTSAGPHGTVRTFVNETLLSSMRADAGVHPIGSIAVKELYAGSKLTGFAIDRKGADGGWQFFEGFEPTLADYYFEGTDNLCANCHRPGRDFMLTPVSALYDAGTP